jgi:hypothetical protein
MSLNKLKCLNYNYYRTFASEIINTTKRTKVIMRLPKRLTRIVVTLLCLFALFITSDDVVRAVANRSASASPAHKDINVDENINDRLTITTNFNANEYREGSWDVTTNTLSFSTKIHTPDAKPVPNSDVSVCWDGWHTVSADATINANVTLMGNTHLILCDGATLTINGCIIGNGGGSNHELHIYGQGTGTGKLIIQNDVASQPPLNAICELKIHGGEVKASTSADYCSGIQAPVDIRVYGGKLTAENTANVGYGINASSRFMFIYGGEVVAKGKGAAENSSYGMLLNTVTVFGGKLQASNPDGNGSSSYAIKGYFKVGPGVSFYGSTQGSSWTKISTSPYPAVSSLNYIKAN